MPPAATPRKPPPPTAGVPATTPGRTGSAAPTLSPGQKLNINTASIAELEALPWIGTARSGN
jgi:DNA uptake protein ComE-like DNA-binding protein